MIVHLDLPRLLSFCSPLPPSSSKGGSLFPGLFGPADHVPEGPEPLTPSPLRAAQAEGMVMAANGAGGADVVEPLRQATSSPFDNLVGVMSAGAAGPGGPGSPGVGMVPAGGGGGYYGQSANNYYGKNI